MKPLTHSVSGTLFKNEKTLALLLEPAVGPLFLRYALIARGSQEHILPALLLDDWGHEKRTLALYQWIFEEGQRFPRAELFGYDMLGEEAQLFLRAIEVYDKLPVYVYPAKHSLIPSGRLLEHFFLSDKVWEGRPLQVDAPDGISFPLRRAKATWWRVNPAMLADYSFVKTQL